MLKRLCELRDKLISVKGIAWMLSTIMIFMGLIPGWMWFVVTGTVIGIRTIEKAIRSK